MRSLQRMSAVLALLAGGSICAFAAPISWNLNNVKFDNGNVVNGFFTTDLSVPDYTAFSITVTGPATNATFTATQMVNSYLPGTIGFANSDFSRFVDLVLLNPLTNAGGTVQIGSGFDCPSVGRCGVLVVNADIHPNAAAPEPAALLLVAGGLGLVAFKRRRA
jgi:hypothetical protein